VYLECDEHEFSLSGSEELTLAIIHQQQASRTCCHSTAQEQQEGQHPLTGQRAAKVR